MFPLPWWRRSVVVWGLATAWCVLDIFFRRPADLGAFFEKVVRAMAIGVIFFDAVRFKLHLKVSTLMYEHATKAAAEKAARTRKDLDL